MIYALIVTALCFVGGLNAQECDPSHLPTWVCFIARRNFLRTSNVFVQMHRRIEKQAFPKWMWLVRLPRDITARSCFTKFFNLKVIATSRVLTAPTSISDALQDFGLTEGPRHVALRQLWLIANLRHQHRLPQLMRQPQLQQPLRQPHRLRLILQRFRQRFQCQSATVLQWKLQDIPLNIRALASLCAAKAFDSRVTAALGSTSQDHKQDASVAKLLIAWLTQHHAQPTVTPPAQSFSCLIRKTVKGNKKLFSRPKFSEIQRTNLSLKVLHLRERRTRTSRLRRFTSLGPERRLLHQGRRVVMRSQLSTAWNPRNRMPRRHWEWPFVPAPSRRVPVLLHLYWRNVHSGSLYSNHAFRLHHCPLHVPARRQVLQRKPSQQTKTSEFDFNVKFISNKSVCRLQIVEANCVWGVYTFL